MKSAAWLVDRLFGSAALSWSWSAVVVLAAAVAVYAVACIRYRVMVSLARYRMAFYDDHLGAGVAFARHALSIDENRKDFDRRTWTVDGDPSPVAQQGPQSTGPERLIQMWFAGVHSDVGGGYEESESRLSDAALHWMVEEIGKLPCPILFDEFYLRLSPSGVGVAHDEVQAMKARLWGPFKRFGWPPGARKVPGNAPLHPSVLARFAASSITTYGQLGPYRPEPLRHHSDVQQYYQDCVDGW